MYYDFKSKCRDFCNSIWQLTELAFAAMCFAACITVLGGLLFTILGFIFMLLMGDIK